MFTGTRRLRGPGHRHKGPALQLKSPRYRLPLRALWRLLQFSHLP
jgi:hypothetical protein